VKGKESGRKGTGTERERKGDGMRRGGRKSDGGKGGLPHFSRGYRKPLIK